MAAVAVTANYLSNLTVQEILADTAGGAPGAPAATRKITHSGYNKAATLNASSTPAATQSVVVEVALTAGSATLDLHALVGTNGIAFSATGLKVVAAKFRNQVGNAVMTISSPVSTGYDGFGAKAVFSMDLIAGGEALIFTNENGGDIANTTNHEIDFDGTASEICEVTLVFG